MDSQHESDLLNATAQNRFDISQILLGAEVCL